MYGPDLVKLENLAGEDLTPRPQPDLGAAQVGLGGSNATPTGSSANPSWPAWSWVAS